MKSFHIILIAFLLQCNTALAQPSYSTLIKFRLFNNGEQVDLSQFNQRYSIISSFGVPTKASGECRTHTNLCFDDSLQYFTYKLENINRVFFFGLYHNGTIMEIALPITGVQPLLAIDLHFRPGKYLLDLNLDKKKNRKGIKTLTDLTFSDQPFYIVNSIDWDELQRKFEACEFTNSGIVFDHFLKDQAHE